MFKRLLLGCIVIAGVISVTAGNGLGQSMFRVGAWCFRPTTAPPDPIYQLPSGEWRVKGAERDKLLNLGLNYFIACTGGLNGEDALVFMGDSLDAAPARKEFKSTLEFVPPTQPYFPPGNNTPHFYQIWWRSRDAELYPQQTWRDSVTAGYQAMYNHHSARIDGVHSFLVAAEGCINQANKINGINFMCDNAFVDSYVQLAYVQTPYECHEQTTYYMAGRLKKADHLMSGTYTLAQNPSDSTGSVFQGMIDLLVSSFRDASRGIRDSTSITRLWAVLQTQQSNALNLRLPTKAQILCSVNLALAHGAKGIVYYVYSTVPAPDESGLLDANRNTTAQYNNVKAINTNYQGMGKSLVTIGGNFLNLTWKEGFSIHQNTTEPISSTYKLYDVTARPSGGNNDAPAETYVEVGVLQNGSTNHYMVVNRRCMSSETREVTITFQSTTNNAYRVTDVFTGCTTTYYPAGGTTFSHTLTLGPGQGKLLKLEDLGAWSGTIASNTTWSCAVVINGDITVNSGTTLTVSSATTVKFASAKKLTINGKLVADSNDPTQRITFTGTTATPGFWNGIIINANSNVSTLRRCDVEYATNGMAITYTGNIDSVLVEKCKFRYHSYTGILVDGANYSGASKNPRLLDNTISNNGGNGIDLYDYAKPAIRGNRIENNASSGIFGDSNCNARVEYNYIVNNSPSRW